MTTLNRSQLDYIKATVRNTRSDLGHGVMDPAEVDALIETAEAYLASVAPVERAGEADLVILRGDLWDAINRYVQSCGGKPEVKIYGNTTRMDAVVDVERIVEALRSRAVPQASAEPNPDGGERLRCNSIHPEFGHRCQLKAPHQGRKHMTFRERQDEEAVWSWDDARGGTT